MNAEEMKETLTGLQALQREVSAWEGNLAHIKTDVDSLERRKASIVADIESSRKEAEDEADKKMALVEAERLKFNAARSDWEKEKSAFMDEMAAYRIERAAFVKERDDLMAMVQKASEKTEKIMEFIKLVESSAPRF